MTSETTGPTDTGRGLVFLIGMPRSGTTLASMLLDRHPRITAPPEPWLMLALDAIGGVSPRHPAGSHLIGEAVGQFRDGLDWDGALAAFAADLYRRKAAAAGADVLVDKTPRYTWMLDRLRSLFPEARFLVLLRNPFAILASFKTSWDFDVLGDRAAGHRPFLYYDLAFAQRKVAEAAAAGEAGDPRVLTLRYEALAADPAAEMRRVHTFLGVEPTDVDIALEGAAEPYRGSRLGDHKVLATAGVHTASIDAWRSALTPAEMQAGLDLWGRDLLEGLGYGDAVAEAGRLGVVVPTAQAVEDTVASLRAEVEARWADVHRTSHMTPGVEDLLAAVDRAHAAPDEVRAGAALTEALRRDLEAARQESQQRLEVIRDTMAAMAELERDHQNLLRRCRSLEQERQDLKERLGVERAEVARLTAFIRGLRATRLVARYLRFRGVEIPPERGS